ncbi:uncharacterized protein LOC111068758 [Drosophila obscura]|uniref:uncharacterized protein LOC111068758 n=1 Tax=Drosophila obscura TaxID=7282 RepID=UPI001BB1BAA6|nr:uncharacterized protein LOC111068758 [Drosophila obscura]
MFRICALIFALVAIASAAPSPGYLEPAHSHYGVAVAPVVKVVPVVKQVPVISHVPVVQHVPVVKHVSVVQHVPVLKSYSPVVHQASVYAPSYAHSHGVPSYGVPAYGHQIYHR